MHGYIGKIEEITLTNSHFRQVLYTGTKMQLVVMSLLPGEEIGSEVHAQVDQFFRIESGTVKIVMDGEESTLIDNMAAVVPAGVKHNLINVGTKTAKLYTVYAPPNHPAMTVHRTKAEAEAAHANEPH